MSAEPVRAPGGVRLIVILAVIASLLAIAGGIFIIADHDDARLLRESGLTSNQLSASGVVWIAAGILGFMVAMWLQSGSRIARLLFGIWAVLNFASGVYAAIALDGEQRATGAFSAAVGVIVLYLLYGSERDREFFLEH